MPPVRMALRTVPPMEKIRTGISDLPRAFLSMARVAWKMMGGRKMERKRFSSKVTRSRSISGRRVRTATAAADPTRMHPAASGRLLT